MRDEDKNRSRRLNDALRDEFKGDREVMIKKSTLTKGRISQLLSGEESFGERAARPLERKLGLRKGYLDEPAGPNAVNLGGQHYADVTQIIQSELDIGDPFDALHRVLKALHIIDADEIEVLALVRQKHQHAEKLMQHLVEIQQGPGSRRSGYVLPVPTQSVTDDVQAPRQRKKS